MPVEKWSESFDYCIAEHFVSTLKTVNNAAERGVKFMSDFANHITTDSVQRAALQQAVEHHRKMDPDSTKMSLNA